MRQEINLYQPGSDVQLFRLSAATAAWMLGILCGVLLLWRVYEGRQVTQLEADVQSAKSQQQRQSEIARAAGVAQAARGGAVNFQEKARLLATQLKERQHALEVLGGGSAGVPGGFADRLEVFARRRVEGVWLDHIVLDGASGINSLAGHTLDPNLVPRYFQGLAGEPALRGTRFQDFRIDASLKSEGGTTCAVDPRRAPDAVAVTPLDDPQVPPGSTRFCASGAASSAPPAKGSS